MLAIAAAVSSWVFWFMRAERAARQVAQQVDSFWVPKGTQSFILLYAIGKAVGRLCLEAFLRKAVAPALAILFEIEEAPGAITAAQTSDP
jgi:hypothetical protein